MDSVKEFINKRKWLFWLVVLFSFAVIDFPQWADSVWDLAEKMSGREIAMPNITWAYWVTIPIGLIMFGIAIWAIRSKKAVEVETETVHRSENLTETLTAMHRRLVELQKEKASHTKIGIRQLEKVIPTLADRMGTVKFKDWHKFERSLKSRIHQAIPQRNFRRPFSFKEFVKYRERVHLVALSVAQEVKKELFQSKEWTFEDGIKISEWLDGYDWGVKKLRDNDGMWNRLFQSISHYSQDSKLRELIQKHIDFSYIYNNACLIIYYSEKSPKTSFTLMLHETLVGNPISPEKTEIALSETLEDITKRLKILDERYSLYQSITVEPTPSKRQADYERTQHLMWADLQITNNSPKELKDVQVNVERCLTLGNDRTKKNAFIMWDFHKIKPFCVYWSETQAQPKQMKLVIPKGATRSALVAFQDNSNGGEFNFNSLNHEWILGGAKIDVEISSEETVLWRGSFYIECRPNYAGRTILEHEPARFEFVEWDKWLKNRSITLLEFGKEGSQT